MLCLTCNRRFLPESDSYRSGPTLEARGSEASSRAGLLLVGYLASRCCVNHSVAGPAEASKSFT